MSKDDEKVVARIMLHQIAMLNLTLNDFQTPDEFVSYNREKSLQQDNLLKSVSDGITPRISQLTKDGYVAIRFSQDLPDGKKYSVKIEKEQNEVHFSFISSDSLPVRYLEHTMSSLINLLQDSFPSEVTLSWTHPFILL